MLSWDGTDITEFIKDAETKIYEGKREKNIYWIIENNGKTETVMTRTSSHTLPCLIDELKPIFNLEKIGTHWFKFHNKIHIISKIEFENDDVLEELTLDKYKYDKSIENEVQRIFLFRELLGVSKNFEKNIILRKKHFYIQPISYYEPNMKPSNSGKVLPNTVLDKWFKNIDLDSATSSFFNIDKLENINEVLLDLKGKMEKIFNRVDPNSITNIDEVLSRIRSRLQFIL